MCPFYYVEYLNFCFIPFHDMLNNKYPLDLKINIKNLPFLVKFQAELAEDRFL